MNLVLYTLITACHALGREILVGVMYIIVGKIHGRPPANRQQADRKRRGLKKKVTGACL